MGSWLGIIECCYQSNGTIQVRVRIFTANVRDTRAV
jgi:hypothetical protein